MISNNCRMLLNFAKESPINECVFECARTDAVERVFMAPWSKLKRVLDVLS